MFRFPRVLSRIPVWFRVSFLFLLTLGTTTFFGSIATGNNPFAGFHDFSAGFFFSGPLLLILVSHELGHYLMCREHGLRATPPHFLPFILFPGTLGAFIRIHDPIPDRRVLMEIGAGGPLAGMVMALPLFIAGVMTSRAVPMAMISPESVFLGEPLVSKAVTCLVFGSGGDMDIMFNSVALAAWLGFLVTLLNLLPVGQLDGGHIVYSLFPAWQYRVARIVQVVIAALVVLWPGWLVWLLLISRVIGLRHPPTTNNHLPIQRGDVAIGTISIIVFILILMPVPISIPEWNSLIYNILQRVVVFFQ